MTYQGIAYAYLGVRKLWVVQNLVESVHGAVDELRHGVGQAQLRRQLLIPGRPTMLLLLFNVLYHNKYLS